MIKISNIKLPIDHTNEDLKAHIAWKLDIAVCDIERMIILRRSTDARKKKHIIFVYTVIVSTPKEKKVLSGVGEKRKGISVFKEEKSEHIISVPQSVKKKRPVIVGTGPAGLFAALTFAMYGLKPIILERGKKMDERIKDVNLFLADGTLSPNSNIVFGEGGAGTFSDGKLMTLTRDGRHRQIIETFIAAGAPGEIIYANKPHIGTDRIKKVIKNIRNKIISMGGDFRFESTVTGLCIEDKVIKGVTINNAEKIDTDILVLAIGASACDTYELLHKSGFKLEQKPFSIGLRIEHPQELINRAQYGSPDIDPRIGVAEYKLVHHSKNGRSAYSFCMCPGGYVVPSTQEEGYLVTNGMSDFSRDGKNANSAIVVGVGREDFLNDNPLSGIVFRRMWEQKAFELGGANYYAPIQRVTDFLKEKKTKKIGKVKPTYKPGVMFANLHHCLPKYVGQTIKEAIVAFDKKVRGFAMKDAILTGVETRTSSAVRIIRDKETFESNIKGIYPIGEGAGYAGGIMSSAVDGIKVAEAILAASNTPTP